MVLFFLSGINLPIFIPLNPAIYRVGNAKKFCFPVVRNKMSLTPHPPPPPPIPTPILPFIADFQNYTRLI